MGANERSELRPDKLAVMVTNIETQRDLDGSWPHPSSPSDSVERLTVQQQTLPGKMEVGIRQTFEVTQTTEDGFYGEGSHWTAREHV
jgi:hypothetical protein